MSKKSDSAGVNSSELKLISKVEASSILGVSTKTIDRMAGDRQLERLKIRGAVRFRLADVRDLAMKGAC